MFDIGFSEMLVIAVVALIVIGPERLPGVARTMGHLFGRMQRYVNDVKSDIQREIELDELRKLRDTVESSAREIEQSVSRDFQAVEREMHDLQALANPVASEPAQRPLAAAVQGERREQAAAGAPANDAPSEQPLSSTAAPPPAVPATSGEQPRQT